MDITFDCSLMPKQADALLSKASIIMPIGGRRGSKTEVGAKKCIAHAIMTPKGHTVISAPTYPMLKVAQRRFFDYAPRKLITHVNKTVKEVGWFNGHLTEFVTASDPDAFRGLGLTFWWGDECALYDKDVFLNVKAALADRRGTMILTTTPRGLYGWVRELVGEAEQDWVLQQNQWVKHREVKRRVELIRFTSYENGFIPHQEFAELKNIYDEDFYRQEILGEFINRGQGLVFRIEREHHVADVEYSKGEHLYIFQDFNLNPMTSVLAHVRNGELHIVGELIKDDTNTIEHGQRLIKAGYGHGEIICDPSGRNRNQGDGKSNVDLLRQMGFKVTHRMHSIPKENSINAVRAMLKNFKGQRRFKINAKAAPKTLECLEKLPYKKNSKTGVSSMDIDKSLGYDHACDAVSYGCEVLFPVQKDKVQAW